MEGTESSDDFGCKDATIRDHRGMRLKWTFGSAEPYLAQTCDLEELHAKYHVWSNWKKLRFMAPFALVVPAQVTFARSLGSTEHG